MPTPFTIEVIDCQKNLQEIGLISDIPQVTTLTTTMVITTVRVSGKCTILGHCRTPAREGIRIPPQGEGGLRAKKNAKETIGNRRSFNFTVYLHDLFSKQYIDSICAGYILLSGDQLEVGAKTQREASREV